MKRSREYASYFVLPAKASTKASTETESKALFYLNTIKYVLEREKCNIYKCGLVKVHLAAFNHGCNETGSSYKHKKKDPGR